MLPTLSYTYIGTRFPDINGNEVVVAHIAERAGIPYDLLKNRMGMKKKRSANIAPVTITDKDLLPRRRESVKRNRRPEKSQDWIHPLIKEWISKKWTHQ